MKRAKIRIEQTSKIIRENKPGMNERDFSKRFDYLKSVIKIQTYIRKKQNIEKFK